MKKIFFLLVTVAVAMGCKCKKTTVEHAEKNTETTMNNCPADAKCTSEVLENKMLSIAMDVPTSKPYYTIESNEGTTVYRFKMSENVEQQYVDGGYHEEIIFQLPSDFKTGILTGKELENTKALFGVFCYCKGKAGYYTITKGTITKTNESITVEIPEIVEGQKVFKWIF